MRNLNRMFFASRDRMERGVAIRLRPHSLSALALLLASLFGGSALGQVSGSIDPNFSAAISSFPILYKVALQPDGKVLVGGQFDTVNGAFRQNIARLNANGTLDGT